MGGVRISEKKGEEDRARVGGEEEEEPMRSKTSAAATVRGTGTRALAGVGNVPKRGEEDRSMAATGRAGVGPGRSRGAAKAVAREGREEGEEAGEEGWEEWRRYAGTMKSIGAVPENFPCPSWTHHSQPTSFAFEFDLAFFCMKVSM